MMNTVKLPNGRTVTAKFSDGRLSAKTYANRTAAEQAAARIGGTVLKGFGRPFYVAPPVKACVVCQQPGVEEFFCPCDLHHGLCATHQGIERRDCAFVHLYRVAQ